MSIMIDLSVHYVVCMHVKLLYFLKIYFCQHVYLELVLKKTPLSAWALVQTEGGLLRPSQPSAVGDLSPISMYEKNDTNCQHVYQCIGYLIDMWALVQTEGGLLRSWPQRHLLLLACLHTVHVYVIMYRESSSDCHMHSKHVYH